MQRFALGGRPSPDHARHSSRGLAFIAAAVALVAAAAPHAAAARGTSPGGGKPKGASPTVRITNPAGGAVLSGTVTVTGTAADSAALTSVTVAVDSAPAQAATGTATWSLPIATGSLAAGSHTLTARATDSAGLVATASVVFSTAAPPPPAAPPSVSITSPASGATAGGTLAVSGLAASGAPVTQVAVELDDGPLQVAIGTTSWTASVSTAGLADGPHSLTAWVTDGAGRNAVTGVQIEVRNTPTCSPVPGGATISGSLYEDLNRNGVLDAGDTPIAGIGIYFFDSSGNYLGAVATDSAGAYTSMPLAGGAYTVELQSSWWPTMNLTWVPDTTGSSTDVATTCASGATTVNFGLRQIVRSTDPSAPLSAFTGPNGLTVQSYDDVVSARALFDDLMTGTLIGPEAAYETVRFDLLSTTVTDSSCAEVNGVYLSCASISYIGLDTWLAEGDFPLFFEYGNHWNMYYTYMKHAASWTDYYTERGVAGNPLVGSGQAWSIEMLTDDWRQLFGSPTAAAVNPLNGSIPAAPQVAGLASWLTTTYRGM